MTVTISIDMIKAATGATNENAAKYEPFIGDACRAHEINTPMRIAGFLSQIGVESGGLSRISESMNYRVEALLALFGRHRITGDEAHKYGRNDTTGQKADQEALANTLYGGEFGRKNLGNTEPGDGWKFRGRGLKQLTGRSNYQRCGDALGLDLTGNPDLLLEPANAALSAGWFWNTNGLNAIADKGDVTAMTKRINGGDIGLAERKKLYVAAMNSPHLQGLA